MNWIEVPRLLLTLAVRYIWGMRQTRSISGNTFCFKLGRDPSPIQLLKKRRTLTVAIAIAMRLLIVLLEISTWWAVPSDRVWERSSPRGSASFISEMILFRLLRALFFFHECNLDIFFNTFHLTGKSWSLKS